MTDHFGFVFYGSGRHASKINGLGLGRGRGITQQSPQGLAG
jgi:hypothetical protein